MQEDQDVKRRRERVRRQSSLLSRLTRQLSVRESHASTTGWSSGGKLKLQNHWFCSFLALKVSKTIGLPAPSQSDVSTRGEDWRVAFEDAGNGNYRGSLDQNSVNNGFANGGHSQRYSDSEQNGDINSNRRIPSRLPPVPPSSSGGPVYRY